MAVFHVTQEIELMNEFAYVRVSIDNSANGSRLKISSTKFDREIYLDPLELDFLTLLDDKEILELVQKVIKEKYQRLEPL
ncbi:hypothetical protein SUSAZ_05355 [Sulfolobus acidocaldarius SUSAZ]|nr:hypothetical protein SUSAZ_05355 [Sulfolobus acidocaldarius SUSAZ]